MIRLESGKTYVWQWDTKQRVDLTGFPAGTMVHYSNCKTMEAPVVVAKMDGDKLVAEIPPELMQEPYDITVYACDEYGTRHCSFIAVISRPKPESYVYEPVEVLRYESLAKRIDKLEQGGGGSTIVDDGSGNITVAAGVTDDGDGNITFA